jgi:hypothetical protein
MSFLSLCEGINLLDVLDSTMKGKSVIAAFQFYYRNTTLAPHKQIFVWRSAVLTLRYHGWYHRLVHWKVSGT